MGCFVNPPANWYHPPYTLPIPIPAAFNYDPPVTLTDDEREVLRHLVEAVEAFNKLDSKHPSDNHEFCYAIHLAQQKIGMRVARRADPDVWFQPEK